MSDQTPRLVLYVEDEPLNPSVVSSELRVETTIAAGLDALEHTDPALVLLDLNLPDGSGFEILRAIRADTTRNATPVFMLSADATELATGTACELGADLFITKPFNITDFLRQVESATS